MISLRRAAFLIFLAGIAGSSWWLYRNVQGEQQDLDAAGAHQVDYFFDGVDIHAMDKAGNLRHRLQAKHIVHFVDDDTSEITEPFMEITPQDAPPLEIRSASGWISPNGDQVHLLGKVDIQRHGDFGIRPLSAVTRDLMINPATHYAETEQDITLLSTGLQVKSKGMRAYFGDGRIELLAKVRGTYEPTISH